MLSDFSGQNQKGDRRKVCTKPCSNLYGWRTYVCSTMEFQPHKPLWSLPYHSPCITFCTSYNRRQVALAGIDGLCVWNSVIECRAHTSLVNSTFPPVASHTQPHTAPLHTHHIQDQRDMSDTRSSAGHRSDRFPFFYTSFPSPDTSERW